MKSTIRRFLLATLLISAASPPARAHEGPPYPIIVDKATDLCVLSVWADPDVGIGTFFMMLDPLPGGAIPGDLNVTLIVQPVSGRLPEARHSAMIDRSVKRVQFKAEIPFDAQEQWHLRVQLQSSQGVAEVATDIEVTPPGFGRWDLVIYLFPFLLVGVLWLRAFSRKRALKTIPP
jgi:hypothetical protein